MIYMYDTGYVRYRIVPVRYSKVLVYVGRWCLLIEHFGQSGRPIQSAVQQPAHWCYRAVSIYQVVIRSRLVFNFSADETRPDGTPPPLVRVSVWTCALAPLLVVCAALVNSLSPKKAQSDSHLFRPCDGLRCRSRRSACPGPRLSSIDPKSL